MNERHLTGAASEMLVAYKLAAAQLGTGRRFTTS